MKELDKTELVGVNGGVLISLTPIKFMGLAALAPALTISSSAFAGVLGVSLGEQLGEVLIDALDNVSK